MMNNPKTLTQIENKKASHSSSFGELPHLLQYHTFCSKTFQKIASTLAQKTPNKHFTSKPFFKRI